MGLTVMVRGDDPKSRVLVPAMMEVEATLLELAVMSPVSVSRVFAGTVTVGGVALPPLLLKVRPFRLLSAPASVKVALPFKVTVLEAAICPPLVVMVAVPPLIVSPAAEAGITTAPMAGPFRVRVPPLTTVPPP